ncbi:hypothetical protein ACLB2K_023781 [Fragaria x ananassa]
MHQIFAAALRFSDLYGKIYVCCDEENYANMMEKFMPKAMHFKEKVGGLHLQKQASFLRLLKQAKELLEGDSKGAADEEIYKLEKRALKVGLDALAEPALFHLGLSLVHACLIKMMVMMTSKGIESMEVLFEMYKSLTYNVGDVVNHTTPGGLILGNVNNLVKHGQNELQGIL